MYSSEPSEHVREAQPELRNSSAPYTLSEQKVHGWMDSPSDIYILDESNPSSEDAQTVEHEPGTPYTIKTQKKESPVKSASHNRMIHYQGHIRHRSPDPMAHLDSAEKLIKPFGGYVQSRRHTQMILCIPVSQFRVVYDSLLKLGDVLEHSVSATDITNSYQDNALRMKIAKSTMDRLMALLKKAADNNEKIRLLKEIQRISEKLEQMKSMQKALEQKATFATIRIHVVEYHPRFARYNKSENEGLHWIKNLDPFFKTNGFRSGFLLFATPKEMVKVKNLFPNNRGRQWQTTSADGAKFWSSRLKNRPKGSAEFWIEAIKKRLSPAYSFAERKQSGDFKILRLLSHDPYPYVYIIGIRTTKRHIQLVEIFYPNEAKERRYQEAVNASITKGAL